MRLQAQSTATAAIRVSETRSDAEKMQAALQRMQAAARREPDAIERLRSELDDMMEVIANLRIALLADSDPSELLNDLENRTARMLGALDGTPGVPAAAALPVAAPVVSPIEEQAFLEAMRDDPVDSDRVPTVSEVVSQLGRGSGDHGGDEPNPATSGGEATTVAMLEAMVEELTAAMPAAPRAESPEPASLPEADAFQAESALEIPAAAFEAEPVLVTEMSAPPESAPETELAASPVAVAEAATFEALPEPEMPAAALEAAPVSEAETSASSEPTSETELAASPVAIAAAATFEAAPEPEIPAAAFEAEPAAQLFAPSGPQLPEVELLSNFARMETMPFLPPEVGTAVIFEARVKPQPADAPPANLAAEEAEPAADLPASGEAIPVMLSDDPIEDALQPGVEQPQQPPSEPGTGDPDLETLLFESPPEPDPDPASWLLEPAPGPTPQSLQPAQRAGAPHPPQPAADQPQQDRSAFTSGIDPLAPLKALSDEERIALFE